MKTCFIKQVTRPEGYNGASVLVNLVYDPETRDTIEVHPHGYHNSHIPPALSCDEVLWLIENHPSCRNFYS